MNFYMQSNPLSNRLRLGFSATMLDAFRLITDQNDTKLKNFRAIQHQCISVMRTTSFPNHLLASKFNSKLSENCWK